MAREDGSSPRRAPDPGAEQRLSPSVPTVAGHRVTGWRVVVRSERRVAYRARTVRRRPAWHPGVIMGNVVTGSAHPVRRQAGRFAA
jgi:hypothetical protein